MLETFNPSFWLYWNLAKYEITGCIDINVDIAVLHLGCVRTIPCKIAISMNIPVQDCNTMWHPGCGRYSNLAPEQPCHRYHSRAPGPRSICIITLYLYTFTNTINPFWGNCEQLCWIIVLDFNFLFIMFLHKMNIFLVNALL